MRMFRNFLFLIFFIGFVLPDGSAQEFNFVQFGQNEGLNHSQVLDISQDNNGNLWLGTVTRSIYRFDGVQFYEYKIFIPGYNGTLYTFNTQVDNNNRIWILTNLGLVSFDGVNSKVIPTKGDLRLGYGSMLFKDKANTIWTVDIQGSVFSMANDTLIYRDDIAKTAGGGVSGYYKTQEGSPCFYTPDGKLISINKNNKPELLQSWFTEKGIININRVKDGYLVSSSEGVSEYDVSGKLIRRISDFPKGIHIVHTLKDRDGMIWGAASGLAFVIDKSNKIHWVSGSETLVKNDVIKIFGDKDENVWISIDVVGIVKYKKHAWKKIRPTNGMDITAMIEKNDKTGYVFGTYNHGLIGLDEPLLVGKPITALKYNSDGKLLASTLKFGLYEIDKRGPEKIFPRGDDYMGVHSVSTDGKKTIVGTNYGLYIMTPDKMQFYSRSAMNLPFNSPIAINDTIFFGGTVSGVLKLSGDSIVSVGPEHSHNVTIYNIQKLKWGGYVVIGEFSQLLFFDSAFKFIKSLDLKDFAANVLLVEFIDQSHFIVGSNDGLFKVTMNGDSISTVKEYGKVDGYNGEEMYVGSSLTSDKSEIVIGTVNGAYTFDQKIEEKYMSPPSTFITGIDFNSVNKVDSTQGYFQLPINPQLEYNEGNVTFSFSATSLSNPYNIQFHYRMDGIEEEWSELNNSQKITYSSLKPGQYTFLVQAISESRVWGNVARYNFVVKPAFWQTAPFYIISGLLVIGIIIFSFYWFATQQFRKLQLREKLRIAESLKLRKQMSMDFHDEMGNRLANMLTQASLLKSKYQSGELFGTFDFFERHAHAIYHGTKDFIWSIDMDSNNMREVISYLRDFGASFFEKNEINFHVSDEILSDQFNIIMPEGYNRNIILIFKEAMTNALKHSKGSNMRLNAWMKNEVYFISFQDDGVGLKERSKGNGLKNMKVRAARIGCELEIKECEPNGTKITLMFKNKPYEKLQS